MRPGRGALRAPQPGDRPDDTGSSSRRSTRPPSCSARSRRRRCGSTRSPSWSATRRPSPGAATRWCPGSRSSRSRRLSGYLKDLGQQAAGHLRGRGPRLAAGPDPACGEDHRRDQPDHRRRRAAASFIDGGLWTGDLGQRYLVAQQAADRRRREDPPHVHLGPARSSRTTRTCVHVLRQAQRSRGGGAHPRRPKRPLLVYRLHRLRRRALLPDAARLRRPRQPPDHRHHHA